MGGRRSQYLAMLDQAMEEGAGIQKERAMGQTSIFGDELGGLPQTLDEPTLPDVPEWSQGELLKHERELTGFYISAHPLARYEAAIRLFANTNTMQLSDAQDGREVKLCGIITAVKSMLTKKGDRMAYLTLEDLHGMVEVIAFPDLYRDHADLIVPEQVVRLTGTVDRGDKGTKLRGTKIEPLAELQNTAISRVMIRLHDGPTASTRLPMLRQVFQKYPGSSSVSLIMALGGTLEAQTSPLPNIKITPSEHFVADIEEVLGKGTITLVT